MSDDISAEDAFAESRSVWWAGIVFASAVTFAIIDGLLIAGTYVLTEWGVVDIPYWLSTVTAGILTAILVTVALTRGTIRYEP